MTKKTIFFLFPILCLLLSFTFPSASVEGVKKGLELTLSGALPAIFPCLVLSGIISKLIPFEREKDALFVPFLLGLICGFPVGAKTICTLVKEQKLEQKTAEKLLPFVSGASPNFLISYCGIFLFSDPKKGLYLYLLQSFLFAFSFLFFFRKSIFKKEEKREKVLKNQSFSLLIPNALSEGMNAFLYVSSCIIFFSFLSSLFLTLIPLSRIKKSIFYLFLELTGGVKSLLNLPKNLLFPLCALGVGWNGFSVHLQTLGLISEEKISGKWYLLGKAIFAPVFFLFALFLQKLL